MSAWLLPAALLATAVLPTAVLPTAVLAGPTYTDPEKADEDFAYQGEYTGQLDNNGETIKLGVQVVALGKGKFRAVGYHGGLPGDGWNGEEKRTAEGQLQDGKVRFETDDAVATLSKDGTLKIEVAGTQLAELNKTQRQSPTLGQAPPAGAVVLFDGKNAEQFIGGRMTDDGLLMEGTTSKQTFGDHKLHIEFRLPYQPEDQGQARGNSGIYVQGRYEIQMLDSFGLEGKHNECGGLYSVKDPDVNMCLPPLAWQTYDIEYTAARFDDSGKLTAHPRVTVHHNGVKVHDNVQLPGERSTTAAPSQPGPAPGPIYLQNHGNPVRYRNIWVVEK
ncbi:MAG: DUF1080 domain-containing protein [Pirellulaceae bacterium]|nr:DUF1080 domain-containing protein [Pirellulaceae bacterium]